MNEYLANKFKWMSFVATWAVVGIHSQTARWANIQDWAQTAQTTIHDFFYFAVPLFFLISGFLFVRSFEKHGWVQLLRRKFWSLYLPFVIWATLALILLFPIRLYARFDIPDWMSFCGIPFMLTEKCRSVHFWYVRALIVFFLLAPVVFYVVKRAWTAIPLMAMAMLLPRGSWASAKHVPVAVFFFLGGALIGRLGWQFSCTRNPKGAGARAVVGALMMFSFFLLKRYGFVSDYYFAVLIQPVFMVVFLWFVYDWIDLKYGVPRYPHCLDVMFFVYCMHLITLCWVGGILRTIFGVGPQSRFLCHLALWQTFWLDILIANFVRIKFPQVFKILAGGR